MPKKKKTTTKKVVKAKQSKCKHEQIRATFGADQKLPIVFCTKCKDDVLGTKKGKALAERLLNARK